MPIATQSAEQTSGPAGSPVEVLRVFTKLGFTCFGGPIAHIGYFREEFVARRRWLDEQAYIDLVALCQFLPGPARSCEQSGRVFDRSHVRGLSWRPGGMDWIHTSVGYRSSSVRLWRARLWRPNRHGPFTRP